MSFDQVALPLLAVGTLVAWFARPRAKEETTKAFREYRRNFLAAYALCAAGDALAEPYGAVLLWQYGFDVGATVNVAWFASLFLLWRVGPWADQYGRKRLCVAYCVLLFVACILTHFKDFWVMTVGFSIAYVAQAIYQSSFEAWLVSEHTVQNAFSGGILPYMFALMFFVKAMAGSVASALTFATVHGSKNRPLFTGAKIYIGGIHGTFELAMVVLAVSTALITRLWNENRGGSAQAGSGSLHMALEAVRILRRDARIALVGALVMCFHAAKDVCNAQWVASMHFDPIFQYSGLLWTCFGTAAMCGTAIGTAVSARLEGTMRNTVLLLLGCLGCGALAFVLLAATAEHEELRGPCFAGLLAFHFCSGWYWPLVGTLKGDIVPEHLRATFYVLFEFAAKILSYFMGRAAPCVAFGRCLAMLLAGIACLVALARMPAPAADGQGADGFYERAAKAV